MRIVEWGALKFLSFLRAPKNIMVLVYKSNVIQNSSIYNLWFNKFIFVLILYCFGIIMNTYTSFDKEI